MMIGIGIGVLISLLLHVLWDLEVMKRDIQQLLNEPAEERERRIRVRRKIGRLKVGSFEEG